MTQVKDFGILGSDFQLKVLSQILTDKTFGLSIIEIIQSQYFDNQYYRQLATIIKDFHEKYDNTLPTFSGLQECIVTDIKDETQREYLLAIVKELANKSLDDAKSTQDKALKFCKQQHLKKGLSQIQDIMARGDFENYDLIEGIVKSALSVGENIDDSIELDSDIDGVLDDDYRNAQPTGIAGLDAEIDNGLAKGELGLLLIPPGVGKSTLLTKFANKGFEDGLDVVQMYFEDKHKAIQRKHYTCASGIPIDELSKSKDFVKHKIKEQQSKGGSIKLKKCKFGTTVSHIRQYLKYRLAKGFKIDMLIVDYIDCLSPSRINGESTSSEETIVRELEALAEEFDIILWSAVQGNRTAISADFVTTDQIQGSIKRVQVAHLIISVNKSLEQKELNLANMAILKSRFGGDGKIFKNMTFNNRTMEFNTDSNSLVSIASYVTDKEHAKEEAATERAAAALLKYREQREKANN